MPKLLLCLFTLLFRLALPWISAFLFFRVAGAGPFTIPCEFRAFTAEPDPRLPQNGFDLEGGLRTLRMNGWLMLLPLVWEIGELLSSFMAYTALRNVSDQMLTIVMLILMAPFLLCARAHPVGRRRRKGRAPAPLLRARLRPLRDRRAGRHDRGRARREDRRARAFPAAAVFYFLSGLYAAALASPSGAPAGDPLTPKSPRSAFAEPGFSHLFDYAAGWAAESACTCWPYSGSSSEGRSRIAVSW